MTTLNHYLEQKKQAAIEKEQKAYENPTPLSYKANVRAAGRSGVREIRIRDFQIISDSDETFAGYNLGPTSPELQLGVLGSCITHITLIQAAIHDISLESVEVQVTAEQHPLAGKKGYEEIPVYPHNIKYTLEVVTNEPLERIQELHESIEKVCPIFNLLKYPQEIQGQIVVQTPLNV